MKLTLNSSFTIAKRQFLTPQMLFLFSGYCIHLLYVSLDYSVVHQYVLRVIPNIHFYFWSTGERMIQTSIRNVL